MTFTAPLQLGGALPVFGVLLALLAFAIAALKRSSGLLIDEAACPHCDSEVGTADTDCPSCGAALEGR